jgi:protein-serine/threonine kinase
MKCYLELLRIEVTFIFNCLFLLGKSQDDTFEHILDGELSFPENPNYPVSSSCKSMIKKLLEPDPKKRLGSQQGPAEIKSNKFFEGKINFNLIRNMTPPIVPKIVSPTDTSNFRNFESENKKLEEELSQEEETSHHKSKKEDAFKDFTPSNLFSYFIFIQTSRKT